MVLAPEESASQPTMLEEDNTIQLNIENNSDSVIQAREEISETEEAHLLGINFTTISLNTKAINYIFHITSIICVCLSLICPLFELIPMLMIMYLKKDMLYSSGSELFIHQVNYVLTIIITFILSLLFFLIGIFSCGVASILLLLVFPHAVVIFHLNYIRHKGPVEGAFGFV